MRQMGNLSRDEVYYPDETKPHRAPTPAPAHPSPRPRPNPDPGQLRAIFNQFDTSKDGALDALELRSVHGACTHRARTYTVHA